MQTNLTCELVAYKAGIKGKSTKAVDRNVNDTGKLKNGNMREFA